MRLVSIARKLQAWLRYVFWEVYRLRKSIDSGRQENLTYPAVIHGTRSEGTGNAFRVAPGGYTFDMGLLSLLTTAWKYKICRFSKEKNMYIEIRHPVIKLLSTMQTCCGRS